MVARLEGAPRAGPGERRRTNRWTGARGACFSTNFVRSHLLGVAAPGQLKRSAAHWPTTLESSVLEIDCCFSRGKQLRVVKVAWFSSPDFGRRDLLGGCNRSAFLCQRLDVVTARATADHA